MAAPLGPYRGTSSRFNNTFAVKAIPQDFATSFCLFIDISINSMRLLKKRGVRHHTKTLNIGEAPAKPLPNKVAIIISENTKRTIETGTLNIKR